jgi:hypothetical protein
MSQDLTRMHDRRRRPLQTGGLLAIMILTLALMIGPGQPAMAQSDPPFRSPDILVVGDSQLTFGAGIAFVDFFRAIAGQCRVRREMSVGVIGVRSSSLKAWTSTSAAGKKPICDLDPKWKFNAGSYGVLNRGPNPYVQIGQGEAYQFCRPGQTPFEAMFGDGYYRPKLLILFFLGNSTERWADDASAAAQDVRDTMANLPASLPCIFMTTAPPYKEKALTQRLRAQQNIEAAFAKAGARCSFVPGYTPATIAANLDNAANFRRKPDGSVKDPFHPTEAAAHAFLELQTDALCHAVSQQLGGS